MFQPSPLPFSQPPVRPPGFSNALHPKSKFLAANLKPPMKPSPDLDGCNRPRNPSDSESDWLDQTPTWKAPEIPWHAGRTLVLEYA